MAAGHTWPRGAKYLRQAKMPSARGVRRLNRACARRPEAGARIPECGALRSRGHKEASASDCEGERLSTERRQKRWDVRGWARGASCRAHIVRGLARGHPPPEGRGQGGGVEAPRARKRAITIGKQKCQGRGGRPQSRARTDLSSTIFFRAADEGGSTPPEADDLGRGASREGAQPESDKAAIRSPDKRSLY